MKTILLFIALSSPMWLIAQQSETDPTRETIGSINLFGAEMTKGVACYRIPSLVTAQNGDLIAAVDQRFTSCGDLKLNRNINIVIRRSKDHGKTWTQIEKIIDYPLGKSASDPSMIVDRMTGEIFLFFNYMDVDREKDVYYLKFIKSRNHGRTWSEPVDITSKIAKPEWKHDFKFITSGRGFQTQSGKLIHNIVNLKKGLFLFASDDHGKSWYLIDTPILPADESKMVELIDGSWMVNSRVNKSGVRYVHVSKDQGKTWTSKSEPKLLDPGCNASIIRYTSKKDGDDKDRLLFSNANSSLSRENMTIRVSYDEGKTWSKGKTIFAGSSAYSSLTVLKNGEIGLFFEKNNYKENVFTTRSLEWLTDGRDRYVKKSN